MFKGRSTVDIIVLVLTFTVSTLILISGMTVAIIEIIDPTVDTSRAAQALISITTAILGALLGLIAGKSGLNKPKENDNE